MSKLIQCPLCGKYVSENASQCPRCPESMEKILQTIDGGRAKLAEKRARRRTPFRRFLRYVALPVPIALFFNLVAPVASAAIWCPRAARNWGRRSRRSSDVIKAEKTQTFRNVDLGLINEQGRGPHASSWRRNLAEAIHVKAY